MRRIYGKSEIDFALVWIIAYVVFSSVAEKFSAAAGIYKIFNVPIGIIMSLVLIVQIGKKRLFEEYGLKPSKIDYKRYLYFLPFLIICTTNLWAGITLNFTVLETVLYVISMICVGFLEEVIFRGLLFTAMKKSGLKSAVIVSSLTFGMGHIVNLLNGSAVPETLLQICYASAIGFLFTIIFHKSKNLYPCIIAHATVNCLSAFAVEKSSTYGMIVAAVLIIVSVCYAFWIMKASCKNKNSELRSKENE